MQTLRWSWFILPCLLCLLATGAATSRAQTVPSSNGVRLRHQWEPGTVLYYRTILEESTKMEGMPGNMPASQEKRQADITRMEVYSVREDGTARIASTMVRARLVLTDPAKGERVYDSEHPDAQLEKEPAVQGARMLLNRKLIMEISSEGRVLSVSGADDIFDSMDPPMDAKTQAFMRKTMSQALKSMPGNAQLPENPVKPGGTWTQSRTLELPFRTMSMESLWKLEGIENNKGREIARLSAASTTSNKKTESPNDAPDMLQALAGMKMETEPGPSRMIFDITRGRMLRSESGANMSMRTEAREMNGLKMPAISMSSTIASLTELVGPEDPTDPQASPAKTKP